MKIVNLTLSGFHLKTVHTYSETDPVKVGKAGY